MCCDKQCVVKPWTIDLKYDLLNISSYECHFSPVNFLINAVFEDVAFVKGGIYYRVAFISLFPLPNVAFIGGWLLKEKIW